MVQTTPTVCSGKCFFLALRSIFVESLLLGTRGVDAFRESHSNATTSQLSIYRVAHAICMSVCVCMCHVHYPLCFTRLLRIAAQLSHQFHLLNGAGYVHKFFMEKEKESTIQV